MSLKEKVFQVVAQIPKGKVSTYGQVATAVDSGPRAVGQALHQNTNSKKIPCHRVVHSDGTLAPGYAFGGEDKQRQVLQKEGVEFKYGKIDLTKFGWDRN